MAKNTIAGMLTKINHHTGILAPSGKFHFADYFVWEGYLKHWLNKKCNGRLLPQKDYTTHKPILILWPAATVPADHYTELYYNERLTNYSISLMGHLAININGTVFNFSNVQNENEALTEEEYFYRPPLGEFSPHPVTGKYNIDDPEKPYYDKFGRLFMRNIHVLRVHGMDAQKLHAIFSDTLHNIKKTFVHTKAPDVYADFRILTNSCSTIIRDGLRTYGIQNLKGIFPRELFINCAWQLYRNRKESGLNIEYYIKKQLKVDEAPYSKPSPIINPLNYFRKGVLRKLQV